MARDRKPDVTSAPDAASLSFEEAIERLQTIVEELEGGSLSLEESIARYEEGVKLSRRLTQTLDQAEKRIERLSAGADGEPVTDADGPRGRARGGAPARGPAGARARQTPAPGAGRVRRRAALLMAARAQRRRPAPAKPVFLHPALADAFEIYFKDALTERCAGPPRLRQAMRYAALGPGKRVRPLLVLLSCEAVAGDWFHALPAAVAVECVHAFSLVHDDLPAMDDDDYRRGRLTTHKKYGEALGLLAGDALLAFAFEELAMLEGAGVPPSRVLEAVRRLARAAGSDDLVGGQALDMAAEGRRKVRAADVEAIHTRKTGALMGACLALGAIAGGADPRTVAVLDDAGRLLGLVFQIHDDLLNAGSSLRKLGKRTGTDAARGKATYHRAVGKPAALRKERELLRSARIIIEAHCEHPARLLALLDALAVREK